MSDLIRTIPEEDVVEEEVSSSSDNDEEAVKKKSKQQKLNKKHAEEFNDRFMFSEKDEHFEQWGSDFALRYAKRKAATSTLQQKIERARLKRRKKLPPAEDEPMEVEDDEEMMSEDDDDDEEVEDTVRTKERKTTKKSRAANLENDVVGQDLPQEMLRGGKRRREGEEDGEKVSFTAEIDAQESDQMSFQELNLSRPLLKALNAMNFNDPTPIQAATIPVAMKGHDICACAATGTGKTAAYLLPVLERLMYRPRGGRVTRVLILAPTRELAVQIHSMGRLLARHLKVNLVLAAGGLDLKSQEEALRLNPDIVVATPGRLIDHLHNSVNFNLRSIEVLVLDEADRILDDNFADQMKELVDLCSPRRQTLLVSATMTEQVEDLAAVSLRNPVKIFVNENTRLAEDLRQEFIRIRPTREGDREAIVTALVKRTFTSQTLVFIQTKVQVHRMLLVLGLLGVKAAALHGDLAQSERLEALEAFKRGSVDVLLATELASRGLDIENVETVINFTMPQTLQRYIHRVGRTARAGRTGRSISLVGEKERRLLKDIIKNSRIPVKSRLVASEVITKYSADIAAIEDDVVEVMKQEEEDREMQATEKKMKRAEKVLKTKDNEKEEDRGWFQDRDNERNMSGSRKKKMEKRKLINMKKPKTPEERVQYELLQAAVQSAREKKKELRAPRTRAFREDDKAPMKKKKKKSGASKSSFDVELTSVSGRKLKKLRAGPLSQQEKRDKRKTQLQKKRK